MALFDKLMDTKNKILDTAAMATQTVKEEYGKQKGAWEQRRAEAEILDLEMKKKAEEHVDRITKEILEFVDGSSGGLFSGLDEAEILTFTKEFYEKLLLPGSKTSTSCVSMHPYIDQKKVKTFGKSFSQYEETEKPILYIKDSENQEFLVTIKRLYFKLMLPENKKYFASGAVDSSKIDLFALEAKDKRYAIKVDGYELAEILLKNAYAQDFISLNEYFRCIREKDFNITENEIDRLIQEKIGAKIYEHIKKYMVYDDELVVYYAGGLDSLTAMDYIACTNKQIIIVDREMFGATANVKQFYYEDITSMATIQNSTSSDLLTAIIDTALTAAFKLCDLSITVAGSSMKVNTLNTIEAERVIAIYHEHRKAIREEQKAVQVMVQPEKQPDVLEQLEKLAKLKEMGIISEEEFASKKVELLAKM